MIFILCTNINKFTYEKIKKKYPFYNSFIEERQRDYNALLNLTPDIYICMYSILVV